MLTNQAAATGLTIAMGVTFFLWKARRNFALLPELPLARDPAPPDVTIVIPARNEAHHIARVVASLGRVPIIVVDDSSTDDTAIQAASNGATVISAPPLPTASSGKSNACAAAAQATTRWILFVNAATWFEPGFVPSLVHYADAKRLQFATVFLDQHCVTLAEKILLPYARALYFTGVSAKRVNDSKSSEVLANGQCMLFERAAYQKIGGHTAVLASVIEDLALARLAKHHGLKLRVLRTGTLGHVRMYDGHSAVWRGFQKDWLRFLLASPATRVQVIAASVLLTSYLPVLGLLLLARLPAWTIAIFAALPFLWLAGWYSAPNGRHPWRLLLAPLGIYLFQVIALCAMFSALARREMTWKGRSF
jgi:chlorobactene glucosyltransferase